MPTFRVNRAYDPAIDVRDHDDLAERLRQQPPNGVIWPLVGARRAGKTWTLRAMERRLGAEGQGAVRFLDLRRPDAKIQCPPGECLLLDEPGTALDRDARKFLDQCTEIHAAGGRVVVAMTPAEWVRLLEAGGAEAQVSARDLNFLTPLRSAEAKKLARTKQARGWLKDLPPKWQRSPYLLELIFQTAEADPVLAKNTRGLLRAVLDRCDDAEYLYFEAVFDSGLTDGQRAVLCDVARGHAAPAGDLLERCGLILLEKKRQVLADPVLEAHLCPLLIHHVSDIHIGPKEAERVDVKEAGTHGKVLGKAAGAAPVRQSYIDHVRELAGLGRAPHLLIVSGDLGETGDSEQFRAAKAWLASVKEHLCDHPLLGPEDPRILLVGGNHDVDWRHTAGAAGARRRHLPFAEAFHDLPHPRLEEPPEARPLGKVSYPDLGVDILLLGSAEFSGESAPDPVQVELFGLIERLRAQAMDEADVEAAAQLRDRVARIDPGLVHHQDLSRVKEAEWLQPVRLAVLHHPVSPLPAGTEISRFAGLINAGEVKDALLHRQFCLVLHGHAHSGFFAGETWPGRHRDRTLRIASAPSLGSREVQEHHGFNAVEIGRERRGRTTSYAIFVRRFGREGAQWVEKAVMGPFSPGA